MAPEHSRWPCVQAAASQCPDIHRTLPPSVASGHPLYLGLLRQTSMPTAPDHSAITHVELSTSTTGEHNWESAQVVNSHLVCDPTMRQPGFDLPWQQWSLLNRFRTDQGHCGACRRKWRLTDTNLCPCGETQTMSHIVESCPLTKLNGGLSRLHSADEDAVSWLTNYGK